MKNTYLAVAGITAFLASSSQAAEFTGGSVALSYSAFTENTSVSRLALEGCAELAFNKNISLQFDLGHQSFNASNVDTTTIGLHGIYHINDLTSLGAFYVNEKVQSTNNTTIGIEAGHEAEKMDYEGYIARSEDGPNDATLVGISARYDFGNSLGLTGSYDRVDLGSVDLDRLGIRLDRDVQPNLNVYVEVGSAKASSGGLSGSQTFVGFGGKYVFGAERGATFDTRGLTRLLPGG